ncbi:MAG: hypothetical protein N2444_07655 [Methylocystis sp.]|nr:hypothetical protein [Methylocystis sp.]
MRRAKEPTHAARIGLAFGDDCFLAPAGAAPLRQVIRDCGADGKACCEGVGHGAPMQSCLSRQRSKLTPACRAIIDRLNKGGEVEIPG